MGRPIAYVVLLLLLGSLAVVTSDSQSQEGISKVRVDEKSSNLIKAGSYTKAVGEVVNETESIIGSVKVSVTLKDVNGKVLGTNHCYADGETVDVNGYLSDTGIFPGKRAPFLAMFSDTSPDSVETVEYIVNFRLANLRSDVPDSALVDRVADIGQGVMTLDQAMQILDTKVDSLFRHLDTRIDSIEVKPTTGLPGDLDNDGDVDFSDFVAFAQNFGKKA